MKKNLGAIHSLYPMPIAIVGSMVDGKPNYMTIAHVGIINQEAKRLVTLSATKVHQTNKGIKENETFSLNMPTESMVEVTDFIGIYTGKKTDKSVVFDAFYGELKTAPMISKCPVNMECKLLDVLDYSSHDVFIGEVMATYANEQVLTNCVIDLAKVKPILFDMNQRNYWKLGQPLARAWEIGKDYKQEEPKE
jgi:flavin reductase (DIM6/NTAB) family NADH-FMN oxidoreductase RutF